MSEITPAESLCPCGAERSYVSCCGRTAASEGTQRDEAPRILQLYTEAQQAATENRLIHALTAAREILQEAPLHYGAIRLALAIPNNLRVFNTEELKSIVVSGLAAYPDDLDMQCDACDVYLATGQGERAENRLQEILREHPHHFRAHVGLGNLANRRHQLDLAEYHFRQAYYQNQFATGVLNQLGGVLSALGRKHEAEHYFRIALSQLPGDFDTLMNWCRMEESRGNLPRAWSLLDMARANATDEAGSGITEAVLHRRNKNYKQSMMALDGVDLATLDAPRRVLYGLERCITLDKMGLYDQAFECAAKANDLKENELGFRYDIEKNAAEAKQLREAFTAARLNALNKGKPVSENEEQPIFICGFTRSGTSMVEQILSAHSNISGGDELPFVYDLAANARQLLNSDKPFPECLFIPSPVDQPEALQVLRQRYLTRLRLTGILEPGVRKFTDKMPMNELHLGLIHVLFPKAKIIHVVRHPLDSVLSTFFTDASHGGFCGYNLVSATGHYRLLLEMTEYYRKTLGIKLLRVRYEDIVQDISKQAGRMLHYLGEEFEQACIEFHLNPRYSRTASYAQVTEKLYGTSVYRYKRYQRHLKQIIPQLEPAIRSLGYKI